MINLDDLGNKISSILGDEESLRQIKELADMFNSGDFGGSDNTTSENTDFSSGNNDNSSNDSTDGFDFGSLLGGIDIGMIMSIMGAMSATDKNSELLMALKPHLSDERQSRVDKAVKMLKIYNIYISLKESDMLNNLDKLL